MDAQTGLAQKKINSSERPRSLITREVGFVGAGTTAHEFSKLQAKYPAFGRQSVGEKKREAGDYAFTRSAMAVTAKPDRVTEEGENRKAS